MSTPAYTRLQRILDLENRQSWRNRSVIGGMRAMAERWADDARAEGVDPRAVAALVALMQRYDAAAIDQRPRLAGDMQAILAGEVDLAAIVMEEKPAPLAHEDDVIEYNPVAEAMLEIPTGEEATVEIADATPLPATIPAAAEPVPAPRVEILPGLGKVFESEPDDDDEPLSETAQVAESRRRQQAIIRRNPRDLQSSVSILPGVGEVTTEQLGRLGIQKVVDLLWHLPARYDDFSQIRTIDQLEPGEQVTVVANLWEVRERKISMNRSIVEGILGDSTGTLHAVWFNKWVMRQLKPNTTLRFSGMIGLHRGKKSIESPVFEEVDEERVATGRISPVYPLTEGLTNNRLRAILFDALEGYARFLNDPLPAQLRSTYNLPDLTFALQQIHFPDDAGQLAIARRRLGFEELFYIQLGVLNRRKSLRQAEAPAFAADDDLLARYRAVLPFAMTGAQDRVIGEMTRDLERSVPMTRLVQGDVGSGKTAVAAAGMWVAATNGAQSALLAPTQILAEQHHRGISRLLSQLTRSDGTPLVVQLLTGRVTGEAREQVLAGLRNGVIDIVVGTTALIQEPVEFANLGMVIVDEQHRFGVEQRGVLRTKAALQPHLMVMSATPIPRSLALTVFGDLDISILDEMPPGRTPIKTKLFGHRERERLYNFVRREVAEGRQAYIVYPLVEESEVLDAGAATAEHKRLQEEVFPDLRVALLHGRMTGADKDATMRAFADGDYNILVSTTVIEVGIDVPNATVMMIEDADRFGLAQLHQLRGRVGRGEHAGYCALVSKNKAAGARERLLLLTDEEHGTDGFWVAEKDLELRGPGEFLGTRQSGLPDLKVAQLSDVETIVEAREAAQRLFDQDPTLAQFPQLSRQVERFWRGHGDVN